jgi:divalent metal cation (Fe/Co/Zn/Cd) transporter
VDGAVSLHEAHDIAQRVYDTIEAEFPSVKHCMVHVNPDDKTEA